MAQAIVGLIFFLVMIPVYKGLKKRHPTVKWDSIFIGSFLLLLFLAMLGSALTLR